jgi:chromate transporter
MIALILTFLKIGAAAYGGGWTIVGVIKASIVDKGWLSPEAFSDLIAIAQVTPGPVALNTATLVGFRLYGFWGALLATLAVVTVPLAVSYVVTILAHGHIRSGGKLTEALKTGTIGLIAMTVWSFAPQAALSWTTLTLSVAAFLASAFTRINPLWIILGSGALGAAARAVF